MGAKNRNKYLSVPNPTDSALQALDIYQTTTSSFLMSSIELSRTATSQTRPQSGTEGAGKYVALQQQTNSPEKNPDVQKQAFQSKLNEKWVVEIACCVGMLAASASIIGFLLAYDGKSLPDWPYGITVNTVLSLLTLILNACLTGTVSACVSQWKWISFNSKRRPLADMNTYDSASRGAWGCFMFLFTSNLGLVLNHLMLEFPINNMLTIWYIHDLDSTQPSEHLL